MSKVFSPFPMPSLTSLKCGLKEAFFYVLKKLFGPKRLGDTVMIQMTRELVRLKAYYLKLLLNTHHVVLRPKENFLQAVEVEWVRSW